MKPPTKVPFYTDEATKFIKELQTALRKQEDLEKFVTTQRDFHLDHPTGTGSSGGPRLDRDSFYGDTWQPPRSGAPTLLIATQFGEIEVFVEQAERHFEKDERPDFYVFPEIHIELWLVAQGGGEPFHDLNLFQLRFPFLSVRDGVPFMRSCSDALQLRSRKQAVTETSSEINNLLDVAADYFELLWERGYELKSFSTGIQLVKFEEVHEAARNPIDTLKRWLALVQGKEGTRDKILGIAWRVLMDAHTPFWRVSHWLYGVIYRLCGSPKSNYEILGQSHGIVVLEKKSHPPARSSRRK